MPEDCAETGKMPYDSRKMAEVFSRPGRFAYRCPWCRKWHLTDRLEQRQRGRRRREYHQPGGG